MAHWLSSWTVKSSSQGWTPGWGQFLFFHVSTLMQTCQRLSDLHVSMRVHSMDKDCCVPQRSHLHLSVTLTVTRVMVFNQCLWNEQQDKEWCYGNLFQPMSLEWATGQRVLLWQSFQPVSLEWTTGQRVLLWQSFQPMPLEWTTGQRVLLWQAYFNQCLWNEQQDKECCYGNLFQPVSLEWATGQTVLLWQSLLWKMLSARHCMET